MGTTAEHLLAIPRIKDRVRATIRRICMFPEHNRRRFPILQAEFEHRSLYGAAVVYERHGAFAHFKVQRIVADIAGPLVNTHNRAATRRTRQLNRYKMPAAAASGPEIARIQSQRPAIPA